MTCTLTPEQLDKQCKVNIAKWLDLDSEAHKDRDDNIALTRKWLKWGLEDKFLFLDTLGRVWGKGTEGYFYPYHLEYGNKCYGIRVAKLASN